MNSDILATNLEHLTRLAGLAPRPGFERVTADHHDGDRLQAGVAVCGSQHVPPADQGSRAVVGDCSGPEILEPDGSNERVASSIGLFAISVDFAENMGMTRLQTKKCEILK